MTGGEAPAIIQRVNQCQSTSQPQGSPASNSETNAVSNTIITVQVLETIPTQLRGGGIGHRGVYNMLLLTPIMCSCVFRDIFLSLHSPPVPMFKLKRYLGSSVDLVWPGIQNKVFFGCSERHKWTLFSHFAPVQPNYNGAQVINDLSWLFSGGKVWERVARTGVFYHIVATWSWFHRIRCNL